MKVAFMIMAHDEPMMFSRLVRALTAKNFSVFAHIDAKVDERPFREATSGHVQFLDRRVRVSWGGYSLLAATLRLIESAHAAGPFDYYIFLSGQDYPVRTSAELAEFLSNAGGKSFMNFYALVDGTVQVHKIRQYCYHDLYARLPTRFLQRAANRLVREMNKLLPSRKFIDGMVPYRGSSSWCLSQSMIDHILAFVADAENRQFLDFFRSVSCADEIFFQTIALNSRLAPSLQNYDSDGIRPAGEMRNENKVSLHYIDWNPARELPAVLDETDFPAIRTSGKFFARKLDIHRSKHLLDHLDSENLVRGADA